MLFLHTATSQSYTSDMYWIFSQYNSKFCFSSNITLSSPFCREHGTYSFWMHPTKSYRKNTYLHLRKKFPTKLSFWTIHFPFVRIVTDFSRLCNLCANLVDQIFLCFLTKPIFFRTFSFPITWENHTSHNNKIESWSWKHTWTAQGCRKTKNTQETEKPGGAK